MSKSYRKITRNLKKRTPREDSMRDAVFLRLYRAQELGKAGSHRFQGKHCRGNKAKKNLVLARDRRLRMRGYSVLMFAS